LYKIDIYYFSKINYFQTFGLAKNMSVEVIHGLPEQFSDLEDFREPSVHLSLAVPTKLMDPSKITFHRDPRKYYGDKWNSEVPMACGCSTYACYIGAAEDTLERKYGDFDKGCLWQPD